MVFVHLVRHWLARRHYPIASWWACIARSLRVLLFYRAHLRLLALGVYRQHLSQVHDDVFHHLSHRCYLAKGLGLRQRVRCVLAHYGFEEHSFDAAYKEAVYRGGGLVLWRHEAGGGPFELRLQLASRLNAEGDLTIAALAGGICLHRLSFSWVDGEFADVGDGVGARSPASRVIPFIARNQGHPTWSDETVAAFAAFERAFPNNSPSFFCFAGLQGIAQALGMDQALAVKSAWQCAYDPADEKHFANAYDGFWQTLGGVATTGRAWRIALPFPQKPLSEMPSKHRKRAATRREYWRAIGESARATLLRHLQDHLAQQRPGIDTQAAAAPIRPVLP